MSRPRKIIGGAIPDGMRRLDLASWTKLDPSLREGAAPVDLGDGSGVRFSLTGGWSTTDAFAGLTYYDPSPLRDRRGQPITGTDALSVRHLGALRAEPEPEVSDIMIAYGICDRIPGAGSENAVFEGIHHLIAVGADRSCRRGEVDGGTGALVSGGTADAGVAYYQGMCEVNGRGASRLLVAAAGQGPAWLTGLAADGAPLVGSLHSASCRVSVAAEVSAWYRFVSLIRLSATDATTRTLAYDWYDDTGIGGPLAS